MHKVECLKRTEIVDTIVPLVAVDKGPVMAVFDFKPFTVGRRNYFTGYRILLHLDFVKYGINLVK